MQVVAGHQERLSNMNIIVYCSLCYLPKTKIKQFTSATVPHRNRILIFENIFNNSSASLPEGMK